MPPVSATSDTTRRASCGWSRQVPFVVSVKSAEASVLTSDQGQHTPVHLGPKRLHDIEHQSLPLQFIDPPPMQKTDQGIEASLARLNSNLALQHGIAVVEHGLNWMPRRPAQIAAGSPMPHRMPSSWDRAFTEPGPRDRQSVPALEVNLSVLSLNAEQFNQTTRPRPLSRATSCSSCTKATSRTSEAGTKSVSTLRLRISFSRTSHVEMASVRCMSLAAVSCERISSGWAPPRGELPIVVTTFPR